MDYFDPFGRSPKVVVPLSATLGRNVARLRRKEGINKRLFSNMTGIGRPLIDRIERGESDVRLSYVEILADALSVDPCELLDPRAAERDDV